MFCFLFIFSSAQHFSGVWNGVGEYMPGQPMTTLIKKKNAEKKLVFVVSPTGKVSGNLIVSYTNPPAVLTDQKQTQFFTVSGNYDSVKQNLLLILTHLKTGNLTSESYLTFKKPDSVYYRFSFSREQDKKIITCTPDITLMNDTQESLVESSPSGGLNTYMSDKNTLHLLPMRIRFEEDDNLVSVTAMFNSAASRLMTGKQKETYQESAQKNKLSKNSPPQIPLTAKKNRPVYTALTNKADALVNDILTDIRSEKLLVRKIRIKRTITLDTCCFKIELYDNGEIDGDIATLMLDGKVILNKQTLSAKSASITINLGNKPGDHVLELFANNMGMIPPNTALVVLTCNKKRYEITLSSTEDINEAVILKIMP